MNVEIIKKDSFNVIGKLGQGSATGGTEWIPPLWQNANGNFNEISNLVKYDDGKPVGIWGAMSDVAEKFKPWNKEGKYLAGCEVKENCMPPLGWTLWIIPAQTYAVITCTQESYGEAFNYVLKNYIPLNGYELAGAVHEYYPLDQPQGTIQLYFPIAKD